MQVTILRDKKQQTVTLQVDSKRHGKVDFEGVFPTGECPLMAQLDPEFADQMAQQFAGNESDLQSMRGQVEALKDQIGAMHFEISPQQAEEIRKQAEKLRDSIKIEDFKIDRKQLDQFKKQMDEFRQNFKPEDFKMDPKQMEDLRKEMEQMKRQMEEMKGLGLGDHI